MRVARDRVSMGPVSSSPPDALNDQDDIVADLSGFDVLSDADPEDLAELAALVTRFTAPAGTVLMRSGDAAHHFLLLTAGQVEVVMGPGEAPKVAVVGAGSIMGEIALLRRERLSATVIAITETRGLKGQRAALTVLIGIPGVVDRVVVRARQRLAAGLVPVPIALPDGTRLRLRPVFPDDKHRLLEASALASARTRYRRFFTAGEISPATARYLTEVDPFVVGLAELRSMGRAQLEREPDLLASRAAAVRPDQLATLVYTSGTTGLPKGTMITHGNIIWTLGKVTTAIELRERERLISFLPLSHIAERMMSDFLPIGYGGETWFARSLATVAEDLPDCRPTIFFAVPRVWEKLHDKVAEKLGQEKGLKKRLISAYVALGLRKVALEQEGTPMPPLGMRRWRLLDKAIGSKIRHTLGLDQTHVLITAAAPIHPDLLRWYHAVGLPLRELYGQTEDCGPTSTNTPAQTRIGSVGQPWPGDTVRIASDGEILVQGGNVCRGYYKDEAGTADLLDADGFMHSGDLGRFDADGYLYITGRKKDLIITAAGKNIAPQELETDLRYHPLVSQAVLVGESRRYLTVLVTLDPDEVTKWATKRGKVPDEESLARDPDVLAEVQAAIDEVNAKRSHAETIRKFRVLPHDLSAADGELTPTLKVKRNVVYERNAALIEDMYTDVVA